DDHAVQLQLTVGTLLLRVRELDPQLFEIDTPNLAVVLRAPGSYRVEVGGAGDQTLVAVGEGAAQADGADRSLLVSPAQAVRFTGPRNLTADNLMPGEEVDELDAWAAQRDAARAASQALEYVAPATPGVEALEGNGTWQYAPDYGYVWSPLVLVAGWAPYRY